MKTNNTAHNWLRHVLTANIVFTLTCSVVFLAFAGSLAESFGISGYAWALRVLAVALLPFAAFVYQVRGRLTIPLLWAVVGADVIWVVATAVILLTDIFGFTAVGNWSWILIADAVGLFAIAEYIGVRRMTRG